MFAVGGELSTDNKKGSIDIDFEFLIDDKKIQAKNPYHMPSWLTIAEAYEPNKYFSTNYDYGTLESYVGVADEDTIELIYTPNDLMAPRSEAFKNCNSSDSSSKEPNGCYFKVHKHSWSVVVNRKTGTIKFNRTFDAGGSLLDSSGDPFIVMSDTSTYKGKGECKVVDNANKF